MRVLKFLLSGLLLIGVFTGCSSSAPTPAQVDTKSGKGAIMVYRPVNPIWKHKRFNIYINDKYEDILMASIK